VTGEGSDDVMVVKSFLLSRRRTERPERDRIEGSSAISRGPNDKLASEDVPLQSSEKGASLDFMESEKSRLKILHVRGCDG
jgi:hypothetical protein